MPSTDGTSQALTVSSATTLMEGLLSAEEADTEQATDEQPADDGAEPTDAESETSDDDAAPDEQDAADEDDETDAVPATQKFRVKVHGEDTEVPLEELLKGYSRTADYTQKTQAHAEKVKAFDSEQTAVREERARLATSLQTLASVLEEQAQSEPDWAKLQVEDPQSFPIVWANWQQDQKRLATVKAAARDADAKVRQDSEAQYRAHLVNENAKLVEAIPEWKDDKVAARDKSAMKQFAMSRGYTEAELGQVADHRVMVLLRDAMLHDRAQKAKPSIKQKIDAVLTATPGSTQPSKRVVTEKAKAINKLAKTGRLDDAAAAMEFLLD